MKTIWIASDHAGFELKMSLIKSLHEAQGADAEKFNIQDLGCESPSSVDYPDYANQVAKALKEIPQSEGFGILICGSGQGMAMRANKFPWIRAALVLNSEMTELAREHNDANILVLGAKWTLLADALQWVYLFSKTPFAGGRHSTRVAKVGGSL